MPAGRRPSTRGGTREGFPAVLPYMGSMRSVRAIAHLGLCVLLTMAVVQPLTLPSAQAAAPIRMGYIGISSDAGIFIALDKGFFKEQGVELALERFGLGADQMALLGSGRLEIASGALGPRLFNAVARGLPISAVADKGSFRKGFGFKVLVVRKALVDSGQVLPDFQMSLIYYNAQWAREHGDEARRWMTAYVQGVRYYNRAFTDAKARDEVITILAARPPVKDRVVYDKMIWPGLNPNGTIAPRTMLDFERWLLNTRQITEFITPSRFVDESFTEHAAKVLGPTAP